MTKEIILTGKYRLYENDTPRRLKLTYYKKGDNPPYLELTDGIQTLTTRFRPTYNGPKNLDDPTNPENLRMSVKDLSRKLTDSGVFPPGFLDELHGRLEEKHWQIEKKEK